jgi:DNA-binding MarR family transcriptional regulator
MIAVPPQQRPTGRVGVAFLLAQLGAQAADRYAIALKELDISPPLAGIMRLLRMQPGLSQQQLAERLGTFPSRIVGQLDDLEARGWVARSRDGADRRINVIKLTPAGESAFSRIATVSQAHDKQLTTALSDDEYQMLKALLGKLADANGLTVGVHPGYRKM